MSPSLANFVFEAINLLLLAGALGWVLFKPVRHALDAERERHATQERKTEQLRAEAVQLEEQARAERESARKSLEERREALLESAGKEASQIVEEARRAGAAARKLQQDEIRAAQSVETRALAGTIGALAARSVERLLEQLEGPDLDVALVRAACAELARLPREAGKATLVESARALESEARQLLTETLGDGFRERVVADLGAGVRVTTPSGQIDATALSIARSAARSLEALASESADSSALGDAHG